MANAPAPPLSFLFRDPAHLIACGFGSGLSPWAPGTAGTLFAWASFPLLRLVFPGDLACLLALCVLFVLGVIVCDITGRRLGVVDHGSIVWDEIVPFWAVLLFCPPALMHAFHGWGFSLNGLLWQGIGFALFRLFDIVKLPPARYFDRRVKNGFGVMMDDLMAAGQTVLALSALKIVLS